MKINIDRYMKKTSVDVKSDTALKKECFAFGYMDGYFDLETYRMYISDFGVEEMYYAKGYVRGVNDRLIKIEDSEAGYKAEKLNWIFNLAKYDTLNEVDYRKLSQKDQHDYDYFIEATKHTRKK